MSLKYLGNSFDFHGGGSDLIFPHHENEIAQTEAYTGKAPFVKYWLHNGFITVNEEKMSKSLGNFFLVKDILAHYPGEVVRFFILATHYRSPLDFSDGRLSEAQRSMERLKNAFDNLKRLKLLPAGAASDVSKTLAAAANQAKNDFYAAMDDDFNTALAISVMFGLAKEINIYNSAVTMGKTEHDAKAFRIAEEVYLEMASIIGVFEQEEVKENTDSEFVEQLMNIIIELRQEARKEKNWAMADAIRDKLNTAGVVLEDSPQGVRWSVKK
jgi:cysteinyl-tRNA synthetase